MGPEKRGTAGFVLGLLAALFSLIPLVGVIAWPLAIPGPVFGILGISKARKGEATNQGLAIAGTVLAAIGLVICIAWVAAVGVFVGGPGDFVLTVSTPHGTAFFTGRA